MEMYIVGFLFQAHVLPEGRETFVRFRKPLSPKVLVHFVNERLIVPHQSQRQGV